MDFFECWWPCVNLGVICNTGRNILGCQWCRLYHCGGQSWYFSSFLMMGSCGLDMDDFFIIIIILLQWLCSHSYFQNLPSTQNIFCCVIHVHQYGECHQEYFTYVWCHYNGSSNWTEFTLGLWQTILDLGGAEIVVSILWLNYFGLDPCLWLFWRICSVYAFFLIYNWPPERSCFQFSIMIHQYFSHSLFLMSTSMTIFL